MSGVVPFPTRHDAPGIALRDVLVLAKRQNRVLVRLLAPATIGASSFEANATVALVPEIARAMIADGRAIPAGGIR